MHISFNTPQTITLAIVFFMIGNFLHSKIRFFNRFCIPAPIIGGILFSLLNFILKISGLATINISAHYVTLFIYLFFTTVGLGASTKDIKSGGSLLFKYWLLCAVLAFSQNILAIFLSKIINIKPLLALMSGSISMEGGHGYAGAFGQSIEAMGIEGALSFGITAATLGLIFGGILGGPVSRFLIERYKLSSPIRMYKDNKFSRSNFKNKLNRQSPNKVLTEMSPLLFMEQFLVILICINLGDLISKAVFKYNGFLLPTVVTCMFVAVIMRNTNDKINLVKLDFSILNFIGEISLGLFLTISLMNIDLYELSSMLPIIVFMVACQTVFIIIYGIFICFKVLGKNYDAAVMIGGLLGHGIGATPNAMANMATITEKYGPSQKAFLIVPLVSSFLLDVVSVPCILLFINLCS